MAVENFYQGEEVSARKLNNLVCAINGLCSTMQALQRDQTIAGLGQNDRPRRLGRVKARDCECGCERGNYYTICFCYESKEVYLPPWGVLGTRKWVWDPEQCTCVLVTRYFVASGVWKEGQARPAGVWKGECSYQGSDSNDGLAGEWSGPQWEGGWIEEPENGRYLFATNEGKLIVKTSAGYDWRYQRLIADLGSWETPNGWDNTYIARNGCTEMIFFPVQYWSGDICQPKARWEQGGMFSVKMDPRKGTVSVCGGMALVEGPLAIGGTKVYDRTSGGTFECSVVLLGTGAYYQVPGFNSNIPAAQTSGARQYLYLGYDEARSGISSKFWWFWLTDTVAYSVCQIPIFSWGISATSEVLSCCGGYVICTAWESTRCHYNSWKMAMPMGVAYKGDCGYVCVAVAQHVPQFRARPIINLQCAGRICSVGNCWTSCCNKVPHGCQAAWICENEVCVAVEEIGGGLYVDVLRGARVEWIKDCAECLCVEGES